MNSPEGPSAPTLLNSLDTSAASRLRLICSQSKGVTMSPNLALVLKAATPIVAAVLGGLVVIVSPISHQAFCRPFIIPAPGSTVELTTPPEAE